METDATAPNTVLGVVVSMLAVMCKRMQQLPAMLEQCWPIMCDPSHKVIALLTVSKVTTCDASTLCYALATMEQNKCWELLAQRFNRFETFHNNSQQYATTCNRTMLCSSHSWVVAHGTLNFCS